jgi:hypothetical protein
VTTLAEIEAAAEKLSSAEQAVLLAHLTARLQRSATSSGRRRVKLPLVQCGPPGSLAISEDLIARVDAEHDAERHAASL